MNGSDNALSRYFNETGENFSTLAARMGRSPSTLTRPVNGERNPSIGLAQQVEQFTDGRVTASEFINICLAAQSEAAA